MRRAQGKSVRGDEQVREAGLIEHNACATCGFQLWNPLEALSVSTVGLYDDGRFPGRLIVSLNPHFNHFDELPADTLSSFIKDIQAMSAVLRSLDGVERVNVAILGNKDVHVHAHVIPRRVTEPNYGLSPWDNAPKWFPLEPSVREDVLRTLTQAIQGE